ncbi:unnamed protein product [Discosporangium mesarthrocarpum]
MYGEDLYGGMMGGMGDMGGMGGFPGMGYGGYGGYGKESSLMELTDKDDVEKFMYEDLKTPAVIGFFQEDTHGDEIMVFRTTVQRMRYSDVRFGLATEDDVLESYKYTSGRVMAYPPKRFLKEGVDRAKSRYPGKILDPEPLERWIYKACTPSVGVVDYSSMERYSSISLPIVTALFELDVDEDPAGYEDMANFLRMAAEGHSKDLVLSVANYAEPMMQMMGQVKEEEAPSSKVALGIRKESAFYRMDGDFSVETARAFLANFFAGKLEPTWVADEDEYMEEEGYPEDELVDETNVVTLEPGNFESVVMEEGKDVMIMFYAPWCGHCKHVKPDYVKVADELVGSSVIVAKMDADSHTPPENFEVLGFPTFYFVKANDKANPIQYNGGRDTDSFLEFIRSSGTTPGAVSS